MAGELKRTLGFVPLVFYGVGSMVGAGIYSVIGAAAGEAGVHLWLSFVFAGLAALLTVLSYAELASMYPKAGGEYQFLKAAFPRRRAVSFMAGYLVAINAAATAATVALAFGGYLTVFADIPAITAAFGLLVLCTIVNIAGIRESTGVSIALILIEVAGLCLIIWSGIESGDMARPFATHPRWSDAHGIFVATALIFFIYLGFEDVANLTEETRNPTRNVPRALFVSVGMTSLLYVLVAFSVLALSEPAALARSEAPLSDAVRATASWRGDALGIAALFATASTALIALISISRLLFGMAREGDMPPLLARTWLKRQTPWVAAVALFSGACVLLPLGKIEVVASVSSFGVLLVFTGVQAAVIALRLRRPDLPRPFRVPFAVGRIPVLPALGIVISVALLTQFKAIVYAVGTSAILLGAIIYVSHRRRMNG